MAKTKFKFGTSKPKPPPSPPVERDEDGFPVGESDPPPGTPIHSPTAAPKPEPENPTVTTPNKSDAIKEALASGVNKPKEVVAWVKDKYGLAIDPQYVSTLKTQLKSSGTTPSSKPKVATAPKPGPRPTSTTLSPRAAGSDMVTVAKQLREMVDQYGKDAILEMVEIVGR